MSAAVEGKPAAAKAGDASATHHRIRITLSSRNVKNLEKVCSDLIEAPREIKGQRPDSHADEEVASDGSQSPVREGTNTWDKFTMRIHKRLIDLHSPAGFGGKSASISIEPGVEVEVTIVDN